MLGAVSEINLTEVDGGVPSGVVAILPRAIWPVFWDTV